MMAPRQRIHSRPASRPPRIKFEHRLVLANWMLELFGAATFEDLGKHMRDPALEGFNEDGISRFHQCLKLIFGRPELPHDILLAYDENIVRHWKKVTEKRNSDGQNLHPKYFQYLCLLFTEIYLDRYFRAQEKLLADLNAYAELFNAGETRQQRALGPQFAPGLPKSVQIGIIHHKTCGSWRFGVQQVQARHFSCTLISCSTCITKS
ncbi:MAG: hypothetical protein SVY10_02245 [Thermodesulfobacteriota bacterium]|nr:hypothetical protein [Thermodesulfobacteriota bacterium]